VETSFALLVAGIGNEQCNYGGEYVGGSDKEERVDFGVVEGSDERGDEGCYCSCGGFGYDDETGFSVNIS